MENSANAGRFAGFMLSKAFARPLRAKGPYSAAFMLIAGIAILVFPASVLVSVLSGPRHNIAAFAIILAFSLLPAAIALFMIQGGATGLAAFRRQFVKRHPHRGPGSPH